jgi:hypothetical protein
MRPPLLHCPVCDASLDAGPRDALANLGFVRCDCCSHQTRWDSTRAHDNGSEGRVTAAEPMASQDVCDRRMTVLQSLGLTRGRLLEIGCGTGRFLLVAKARQFEVTGVESDAAQRTEATSALGIPIASSLDCIELASTSFDAVALWGVLPSVDRPVAVLSWAADRMRAGAPLGLSVRTSAAGAQHCFTHQSIELGLLRAGFELVKPPAQRGLRKRVVSALQAQAGVIELWGRRR